ncbi:type 1 glutamine amidotransferase [Acidilutibacter cellobiosedens]|uniref:Type 1 glutamine amidotransferase n=1 Tax=Acidilutibacter cellobiosedens TaxID=2507161 RepID=A0A410QEK6_9FIRM|nr:type 1 glutamine amidotransferase domain-containing protein [Acidilutibacter cellobiosedens]QAT62420.1 type 1 glutamine amidotransferase [Acidilutibacter cellobiosedens]
MKRIAVLAEQQFEDMELMYPYYRLLEEGYQVDVVGTEKDKVYKGKNGYPVKSTHASREVSSKDYDGVIIPGGYSPDYMRRCKETVEFVKEMDREGKLIGAICHGPWMLASCCKLKGKKVTSFISIKDDLTNAGAIFVDKEVVVDGNLITSRTPKDLVLFMKSVINMLK